MPVSRRNSECSVGMSVAGFSELSMESRKAKFHVCLENGRKIAVPVSVTATVTELHVEAVRRASKAGVLCNVDETLLEEDGGTILFGDDLLEDLFDLTQRNTLHLALSGPQLQGHPNVPPEVYVRWITPKRAVNRTSLSDIAVDSNAFPASTSLSELTNRAMIRLYPESMPQGPIPQHMIELEFYLTDCQLETHIQGDATLYDLELKGTQQSPLNIFVIRTDLKYLTTSKAYDRFGFTSSLRGVSTFVTCLKILLSQIKRKVCTLVNVLEVLWEVTHFPPALIAFRQMNDRGIETGKALPLAVLAECFYELSINMVPSWIAESPNRVLEASRQVFVWLQSLQSAISRDCSQPLVHRVEILEIPAQPDSALKARFPFSETVNLPRPKSHRSSLASRVLVSLEIENPVPPRTLALALNGLSEVPWNYFFYYPDALDLSTHKKVMAPHISEFVNLIHTANQLDSFKMVGPEQLDECPTSSLPVITLSGDGYVSTYQYEDIECSDRSFYTWNIVSGKETMPRSNPSQELLQRILPIIAVRKADLSWEIDAWSIGKIALDTRAPEESIVICVDTSSSMRSELSSSWLDINMDKTKPSPELTRLDEAKNVFKDFVTRVVAQNLPTHIGLLKFSSNSRIHVLQSLHPLVVNSEAKLNNIQDGGSTAIWDALITAEEMLVAYKKTHPTTICRIIVLTDGEDNDSYKTPSLACERLLSNQIVLDAMVLGTHSTENLFSIVKHTGGYAFKPKTRADLFRIFILESFVNIQMRPPITRIPITNWDTASPKLADMESAFDFPPHRPHPNEHDDFVNLSDARRILARFSGSVPGWSRPSSISSATSLQYGRSSPSVGASGTGRILLHEAKAMVENEHKYMEVSASESNMGFWKVWMQGPPESPYEKGVFLLYIHIGENYPTKPPEAKFITPILHPSVMKQGRICHPILGREWDGSLRIYQALQHLWAMLMVMEFRDAVDPLFTTVYCTDPDRAKQEIEKYVEHFASRTRPGVPSKFQQASSLLRTAPY